MKLSELKYPIALVLPDSVAGGRSAELASYRRFRSMIAEYFLSGGWNGAQIVDADGNLYKVVSITLLPLRWFDYLLAFVTAEGGPKGLCQVDAELKRIEHLTLEAFIDFVTPHLLLNPDWWDDYEWVNGEGWQPIGLVEKEIDLEDLRMAAAFKFDGVKTVREAISDLGVWDNPSKRRIKCAPDVPIFDQRSAVVKHNN